MKMIESIQREIKEIYESRSIFRSLVAKNLYGKYKNSFLGFAWNFVSPIVLMLMYYVIFTEIRTSGIENGWIFISTAIFMFSFLSHCITGGTGIFTSNSAIIKKMYFPREILVLANVTSSMIVCLIGYGIVLTTMAITGYPMDWRTLLVLPPLLLLAYVFGIGCVFFLSSITVYIRDIQYALGMMGIALFIMTPMRYMATDATGILATLIWYNPLTYYVESIHDILFFTQLPNIAYMIACTIISMSMAVVGYSTFRLLKRGFVKRL